MRQMLALADVDPTGVDDNTVADIVLGRRCIADRPFPAASWVHGA
jgi:hypothetical protein